jgi:hypothetical protein
MNCPHCSRNGLRYSSTDETAVCIGCNAVYIVTLTMISRPPVSIMETDLIRLEAAHKKALPKPKKDLPEFVTL